MLYMKLGLVVLLCSAIERFYIFLLFMDSDIEKPSLVTVSSDGEEETYSFHTSSIPGEIEHMGKKYKVEVIKKEVPEEMIAYRTKKIILAGFDELLYFFTCHILTYFGAAAIIFWGDWNRLIAIYALIFVIWGVEYFAYALQCKRYKHKDSKLFPCIKVSNKKEVITTMSPKAYVGKIDLSVMDVHIPILPLKIRCVGHVFTFSAGKFRTALTNAIKAKEEREQKKA